MMNPESDGLLPATEVEGAAQTGAISTAATATYATSTPIGAIGTAARKRPARFSSSGCWGGSNAWRAAIDQLARASGGSGAAAALKAPSRSSRAALR